MHVQLVQGYVATVPFASFGNAGAFIMTRHGLKFAISPQCVKLASIDVLANAWPGSHNARVFVHVRLARPRDWWSSSGGRARG